VCLPLQRTSRTPGRSKRAPLALSIYLCKLKSRSALSAKVRSLLSQLPEHVAAQDGDPGALRSRGKGREVDDGGESMA